MYEVCEIVRLCHEDPAMRKAAKEIQGMLMTKSRRGDANALPHEGKSHLPNGKKLPPLLPRPDVF